jgi:hypothetical protein
MTRTVPTEKVVRTVITTMRGARVSASNRARNTRNIPRLRFSSNCDAEGRRRPASAVHVASIEAVSLGEFLEFPALQVVKRDEDDRELRRLHPNVLPPSQKLRDAVDLVVMGTVSQTAPVDANLSQCRAIVGGRKLSEQQRR